MWLFVAAAIGSSSVAAEASFTPCSDTTASECSSTERADADGDGIADDDEDANHNGIVDPGETDPTSADTDHDNVPDGLERQLGTDPSRADDVPPIPEPLYFDLIRNLGSRRNELEANVLMTTTFDSVAWGPEVEWTPVRNFGVELEVPFTNGHVEALKAGAQWTIGSLAGRRMEVGTIGLYEHSLGGPERRATLGAVTGVRFTRIVHGLTVVGPTLDFRYARPVPGATLNPSLFVQMSRYVTTGLELGYRGARGERPVATVLPQVHLNPTHHLKVQLGAGAAAQVGLRAKPFAALRVSYEL